jgi:hypothetical protein
MMARSDVSTPRTPVRGILPDFKTGASNEAIYLRRSSVATRPNSHFMLHADEARVRTILMDCHQYQRLHGRLLFLDPVLGFRKLGYVIASVLALLPTYAGEFFATKFA